MRLLKVILQNNPTACIIWLFVVISLTISLKSLNFTKL